MNRRRFINYIYTIYIVPCKRGYLCVGEGEVKRSTGDQTKEHYTVNKAKLDLARCLDRTSQNLMKTVSDFHKEDHWYKRSRSIIGELSDQVYKSKICKPLLLNLPQLKL